MRKPIDNNKIIGFTGTRLGMTGDQAAVVSHYLLRAFEAHHGDCEGGDEQFHDLCRQYGVPVVIHPPEDDKYRAFCQGAKEVKREKPYLIRNRDIVMASTLMLGCPKDYRMPASLRGQGTWSTINFTRKQSKRVHVILPNGDIDD